MCWQCVDEETMFDALGLSIVARTVDEDAPYPPIILRDGQGAEVVTNPAADWLVASAATIRERGTDTENIPYLLPLPAVGETIQIPCACSQAGCRGTITITRHAATLLIDDCQGWRAAVPVAGAPRHA